MDPTALPRLACGLFLPLAATPARWWLVAPNAGALVARARASTLPPGRALVARARASTLPPGRTRTILTLLAALFLVLPAALLLLKTREHASAMLAPGVVHLSLLASHLLIYFANAASSRGSPATNARLGPE
ncbi:hypothetical protein T484DRAFT_1760409 [Baffinella frigidus]|nr:hypothetical protein T484DRAFT_1760409 [Cryptophyta sp. CCMP2293]